MSKVNVLPQAILCCFSAEGSPPSARVWKPCKFSERKTCSIKLILKKLPIITVLYKPPFDPYCTMYDSQNVW